MSFERQNGAVLATPPKLTLSSLPTHKALPPTPGTKTPPLHPMLSIPFQWEEAPGRPRSITNSSSTPYKPRSFRCLDLPPRLLGEVPSSPTTVLDGPKAGRTLSHKFLLEDISPKSVTGSCELGLVDGPGLVKSVSENAVLDYYGPYKWDQMGGMKPHEDFGDLWVKNGSVRSEVDVEGRMMRFRRRTKGSLYKLSNKSTRLLENIYEGLRQMVSRKRKEGIKLGRTRAP